VNEDNNRLEGGYEGEVSSLKFVHRQLSLHSRGRENCFVVGTRKRVIFHGVIVNVSRIRVARESQQVAIYPVNIFSA